MTDGPLFSGPPPLDGAASREHGGSEMTTTTRPPAIAATAPAEPEAYTRPMAAGTSIRILLCDDHELVRRGIRSLLEAEDDLEVVGEAGDAETAIAVAGKVTPDVVVMDVRMPGRSGIEACRDIRSSHPEIRVLMLTSFADDEALFTSIMAGAAGYVLKQIKGGDLVGAVRQVAGGKSLLDPNVTERVLARLRGEVTTPGDVINDLTPQERRILALVAEGQTNHQIAERVHLADKTVKNYVSNILMKLGLSRRAEVAALVAKRQTASRADPELWP